MSTIYCGNNAANTELLSGNSILGTRYECLKKGIGRGMNMPLDPTYGGQYIPIDERKMYCGTKNDLPKDYDYMGNLPHCLQKGVGIGKGLISGFMGFKTSNEIVVFIFFVVMSVIGFIVLYLTKPSFLVKKDKNNILIDWRKFMGIYIGYLLLLIFLIFYLRFM